MNVRQIIKLSKRQSKNCPLCGVDLSKEFVELYLYYKSKENNEKQPTKRHSININVDHVIPKSKGGKTNITNCQLAHATCNTKKGNQIL